MDATDVLVWGMTFLFVVVGVPFVVGGTVDVLEQHDAIRSAERTTGTVTSFSSRRADRADPGSPAADQYGTGGDSGGYVVSVAYQYTVDGQTYGSRTLKPHVAADTVLVGRLPASGGPKELWVYKQQTVWDYGNRFREGEQVTVYYDPRDPSSSYLLRWYSIWPYGLAVAGLFALSLYPLPRLLSAASGWLDARLDPGDDEAGTPGVDVPVLSSFELDPSTVSGAASVVVWGGFAALALWYPYHYSTSGDRVGAAIIGAVSISAFAICLVATTRLASTGRLLIPEGATE